MNDEIFLRRHSCLDAHRFKCGFLKICITLCTNEHPEHFLVIFYFRGGVTAFMGKINTLIINHTKHEHDLGNFTFHWKYRVDCR